MTWHPTKAWWPLIFLLAAGCQYEERYADIPGGVPIQDTPELLADWHMVAITDSTLILRQNALPYDLNTPLFSDYAHKLRTVWMPDGTYATYREGRHFHFPVGTVFTKTFYYPEQDGKLLQTASTGKEFDGRGLDLDKVHLIETRILVKRKAGWDALAYVWNDEQSGARLEITGDIKTLSLSDGDKDVSFSYVVPNKNECASCHATNHSTGDLVPIGPKPRHLNKRYQHYQEGAADQLTVWQRFGYLRDVPAVVPEAALWAAGAHDNLEHRARSYLDINCGHCHNPVGPADTSGLFLHAEETRMRQLGVCKPPIAAGRGSGGLSVSIYPGEPSKSMLISRMQSADPSKMMPELGRSLVHREGVDLAARWIESLEGRCSFLRL